MNRVCFAISREVSQQGFVFLSTLEIVAIDEHFNLLLDHLRIRLEHKDVSHDVGNQGLVWVHLVCLHDLDAASLNHECSFFPDLVGLFLLFLSRLYLLLFQNFYRDVVDLDRS